MGRCVRRTKKVARIVAKQLTPIGMSLIADLVGITAHTDWSSAEKREIAVGMAQGGLKRAGIDAKEAAIRLAVEYAVNALKSSAEALDDLGQVDDDEIDELVPTEV